MTADALNHALFYAERFGPIWPQTPQKTGYAGTHGAKDATRDPNIIQRWWAEHADAIPALLTGSASAIIALDIDIKNGRHGIDTLELLGVSVHPRTPTAHTPSGGLHLLFRSPGHPVRNSVDKLGPGLEVKDEGGWITLPPGPGRRWDQHLGPHAPLAPMPNWMVVPEQGVENFHTFRSANLPTTTPTADRGATSGPPRGGPRLENRNSLSRYGEAALDNAVRAIVSAPAGQQHDTLNRECFAIGGLVAGGVIPAALALESLQWAARKMTSYDRRHHWHPALLDRQIRDSFLDGQMQPRQVPA